MKPAKPPRTHYRPPKRFYYEIHIGAHRVDGVQLFSGMLEAEKAVDQRADQLRQKMGKPLRGYMIMRLGRKMRHRAPILYNGEEILLQG